MNLLLFIIMMIIFNIIIFIRAREMGYSGFLWVLMGVLFGPIGLIYLLAALPNRKLDQKRAKEMRLLKVQLEQARLRGKRNLTIRSDRTIDDKGTISDNRTID
jgi:hypothetical protein